MSYTEERNLRKLGLAPPLPTKKERKPIAKISAKQLSKNKAAKESLNGEYTQKEKWFKLIRTKLTGTCACGCGNMSSKNDYINVEGKVESHFRASCCHIFPKKDFESVMYHPLNFIERAFWGGCHSQMDNTSLDRWVKFKDWQDIKDKFYELAPLLTEDERKLKFYKHLESLVYSN